MGLSFALFPLTLLLVRVTLCSEDIQKQEQEDVLPPLLAGLSAFVQRDKWLFPQWEQELRYHEPSDEPGKKSTLPLASASAMFNETGWSTYRPHLYFGLKNRRVDSPMFGLMWYQQRMAKSADKLALRHWALHEDEVVFMWNMHDGRSFGSQNITDGQMELYTDWFGFGAASWKARVFVHRDSWPQEQSLVLYFGLQDEQSQLRVINEPGLVGEHHFLSGQSAAVGGAFDMKIQPVSRNNLSLSEFSTRGQPFVDMAKVADVVREALTLQPDGTFAFGNSVREHEPNFVALQITAKDNSVIEITFLAENDGPPPPFEQTFNERAETFHANFSRAFPIAKDASVVYHKMGNAALSNLLGGIGVWHGNCSIRSNKFALPDSVHPYGPFSLISAVPSRTGFPRGFIWDEGFHNLLIHKFDPALTIQIISAYLDMMNVDGWIPREIVLGSEALARMPGSFLVQEDWVANPPMFFYVMRDMVNNPEIVERFGPELMRMYPRMKQLYIWLRNTQHGPQPGTFRWRGRNSISNLELNPATLSSGFDDYPRATHPTDDEYHVDLLCWMAMSSTVLSHLAKIADDEEFLPAIQKEARQLNDIDSLDRLHWSEKVRRYCDYGLHSESVKLVLEKTPLGDTQMVRKVLKEPRKGFVENVNGYNNLFPLLLKMLPANSTKLGHLLDQIEDPREFWTPFGLRSVSTLSPYYNAWNSNESSPYWRGPIWINMNYFALESLKHYSTVEGPNRDRCTQIYADLRRNVLENLASVYEKTGFIWEHYDDVNGHGEGNHPFTGWSTLLLKVMSESY